MKITFKRHKLMPDCGEQILVNDFLVGWICTTTNHRFKVLVEGKQHLASNYEDAKELAKAVIHERILQVGG